MNLQCDRCQRHNSLRREDACVIAPDVKKIYYVCDECGHTQVKIVDYSIRKSYNEEYKPDLWWEKLPTSVEKFKGLKDISSDATPQLGGDLDSGIIPVNEGFFDRVKTLDDNEEE